MLFNFFHIGCNQQFNRNSFSNIVALLVITGMHSDGYLSTKDKTISSRCSAISAIFLLFVFAYLRQLLDPSSVANVSREPELYPVNRASQDRYKPYDQYSPPIASSVSHKPSIPYRASEEPYDQYPAPIGPPPIAPPPYHGKASHGKASG
jgi:hypothetical protein